MEQGMIRNAKSVTVVLAVIVTQGLAGPASGAHETAANTGVVHFDGAESNLALQSDQVHPRVSADLGDNSQHFFIVDTGASVNVIDSGIAESRGYKVVGETEIGAPGGPQIPASIVSVPLLRVGDVSITDAEFVTMDIAGFSGGATHGVLGVGLFEDYLVTIDRRAGHIRLSRQSLSADEAGVLAYDTANAQIDIEILVAGRPLRAHSDTGSMGEFLLPGELMATLPLQEAQATTRARLVGGERDITFAQLQGNIQFADLQFENPTIAFMTPGPGAGNIGSKVLADYLVTIDQKKHLIAFRKATEGVTAADNRPRRLGLQMRGMHGSESTLTIAGVVPGSVGEQAGLLAGDVLVAINAKPTGQYDMAAMGSLFASKVPLELQVEREGKLLTIEIE
jgi:predicted aspartyl protease